MKIGIWDVGDQQPRRLASADIGFERHLEEWIATDPSLLHHGLTIVGRQLPTEGGPIDLLALDPQARWIVIEIKRGILVRDVIAQVMDYASALLIMPEEELREKTNRYLKESNRSIDKLLEERSTADAIEIENRDVLLMVVGTGKNTGLDRIAQFMSRNSQVPISVVTFNVFKNDTGNHILARELFEPEASSDKPAGSRGSMSSTDQICALADKAGVGMEFRTILQAALDVGLYARPYKKSIMYTPPSRRDRMVFTVWAEMKDDGVSIYAGPDTLLEFYPFDKAEVVENLGFTESGWHSLNSKQAERFSYGLRTLFKDLEIDRDL